MASGNPILIKLLALGFLVLQNASVALVMRYSFVSRKPEDDKYLPTVAVFSQEVLKFLLSICFLLTEKQFEVRTVFFSLYNSLNFWEMANISVPAFLYIVQNNLLYVASANLSPAPLQLLFQLKIFTTAILSVALLGKRLSWTHWSCLFALFVGIGIVQLSVQGEAKAISNNEDSGQNPILGFVAILIAVTCSGLAGVWFEKILKKKEVSLWVSNFQLSLISIGIAIVTILFSNSNESGQTGGGGGGWFTGFTAIVWTVVVLQSAGGLITAVVVKYTDNIIKGYATSIATVLGTVGSMIWFDFQVSLLFLIGSIVVLVSAYVYGTAENLPPSAATAPSQSQQQQQSKKDSSGEGEQESDYMLDSASVKPASISSVLADGGGKV